MKLSQHHLLPAICTEYLLGTLRGSAKRRFEKTLQTDVVVRSTLQALSQQYEPSVLNIKPIEPSASVWSSIQRTLGTELPTSTPVEHNTTWWQLLLRNAWGVAGGVVLVLILSVGAFRMSPQFLQPNISVTAGIDQQQAYVVLSSDRGPTLFKGQLNVLANAGQSYELWLVPANGSAPQSLGLLSKLNISPSKTIDIISQVRGGAKLAVSIEPLKGSPTGGPTGPVTVLASSSV